VKFNGSAQLKLWKSTAQLRENQIEVLQRGKIKAESELNSSQGKMRRIKENPQGKKKGDWCNCKRVKGTP